MKALTKEIIVRDFPLGISDELAQRFENAFKGQLFSEEQISVLEDLVRDARESGFETGLYQSNL